MSIENFKKRDLELDLDEDFGQDTHNSAKVHIRIQQRNGRKTLTTVQGLGCDLSDCKKILKAVKGKFACNGTTIEDPEHGNVIQLQGNQRNAMFKWLTEDANAKFLKLEKRDIQVHGF